MHWLKSEKKIKEREQFNGQAQYAREEQARIEGRE